MKTKDFLATYKKVLGLVALFVILLISCLMLETFTAGGTNKTNDFIITPHLLVITLYSLGVMIALIIPIVLYKVYKDHITTVATDEADNTLMAQIAISTLAITLSVFLVGILIDHFFMAPTPTGKSSHRVFETIIDGCVVFYKGVAVLIIAAGLSMAVIKTFKSGVAPGVTYVLSSTWAIIGIAAVCFIFLLATCNRSGSMNTNITDPLYDESTPKQGLTDWGTDNRNAGSTGNAEQDFINDPNIK